MMCVKKNFPFTEACDILVYTIQDMVVYQEV